MLANDTIGKLHVSLSNELGLMVMVSYECKTSENLSGLLGH